jgi:four helix bundle protein
MEKEFGYKNLNVWKKADQLVLLIYAITKKFPKEELFGLISQMRRSAISIPANIVEGYGRRTPKDKINFYYIARGSLNELEYYIDLSLKLRYMTKSEFDNLKTIRNDTGKLLNGLIRSIKT